MTIEAQRNICQQTNVLSRERGVNLYVAMPSQLMMQTVAVP